MIAKVKLVFFGIINVIMLIFALLIYNVKATAQSYIHTPISTSSCILTGNLYGNSVYLADLNKNIYQFDSLSDFNLANYQLESDSISSLVVIDKIYATHSSKNYVSCIDQGLETLITVGSGPCACIFDGYKYIWTADRLGNSISSIDITSSTLNETYPIGWEPNDIAYDGAGNVIVCLKSDKKIAVFNIENEMVASLISVGNSTNYPKKIFCDSNTTVWVMGSTDIVQKIDLQQNTVTNTFNITPQLTRTGVFYSPQGGDLPCVSSIGTKATPIGVSTNLSTLFIGDDSSNPAIHFFNKKDGSYILSVCLNEYNSLSSFYVDNFYIYTYSLNGDTKKFSMFNSLTRKNIIVEFEITS